MWNTQNLFEIMYNIEDAAKSSREAEMNSKRVEQRKDWRVGWEALMKIQWSQRMV